jgi:hypothetical protein
MKITRKPSRDHPLQRGDPFLLFLSLFKETRITMCTGRNPPIAWNSNGRGSDRDPLQGVLLPEKTEVRISVHGIEDWLFER